MLYFTKQGIVVKLSQNFLGALLHFCKKMCLIICASYNIGKGKKCGNVMEKEKQHNIITPSQQEFFLDFYENNRNLISYFVRKCSLSADECEDLIQDVLVRLLKQIPTLQLIAGNRGKITYYIHATVRSAVNESIRKKNAQKMITEAWSQLQAGEENARYMPLTVPEAVDVEILKESLSQQDWDLLEGKYILGYADRELCQILGCAEGSVRMALTRARRRAKKVLLESNEGGDGIHG